MSFAPLMLSLVWTLAAADEKCVVCHAKQVRGYYGHTGKPGSTMASALYTVAEAEILAKNPKLDFQLGRFTYSIDRKGGESIYSVSDTKAKLFFALRYAFGHGAAGQTYLYQHKGQWYESRLSYYKETDRLDLTMSAPSGEPRTLADAAGREMTPKDVAACFACHTTDSLSLGLVDFDILQAGIGCTNCHRKTAAHLKSMAPMKSLKTLTSEEQSEACGRCHRTWADIAANGPRGVNNVRFQPYRLANSKCYDSEDRRIGCAACHDVHAPLEKNLTAYDDKCNACHVPGAKVAKLCPKRKTDCASCHMPRFEMPGSHHQFTDHMIRIVRKNETYPN